MTVYTGPILDELKQRLVDWWLRTRKELIEALEQGYPYGSVRLTPDEQINRFVSMTPQDWDTLIARLMERHKGEPNQGELVQKDLQDYQTRMYDLMQRRG